VLSKIALDIELNVIALATSALFDSSSVFEASSVAIFLKEYQRSGLHHPLVR
jgi:hypothetical protein